MTPRTILWTVLCLLALGCSESNRQPGDSPGGDTATTAPAPSTAAPKQPMGIARKVVTDDGTILAELDNGLKVVIRATRTAPVVHVRSYVHAGGLYEGQWLGCGLSHLLEHLVAKESIHSDQGAGQMRPTAEHVEKRSRTLDIGGQSNAATSLNYTTYYISASASKTMDCIDLIADQMTHPEITPADFRREHAVVQRELEMGSDNTARQMWYAHTANCYGSHPAAVPVIGYAEPLVGVTREDLLAYHEEMYVPQNMVFAVVGDVDEQAVLERVRGAFSGFRRGRMPSHELPDVQPFPAVRRVVQPAKQARDVDQRMSFLTIPLLHEDLYALDVLAYILGEGRTSRLYQAVVRGQVGTSVWCSSWTPTWGKGTFTIGYNATPELADQAEQVILGELRRVVKEGVTDDELARAKRQKLAEDVYSQQSAESIAGRLAHDLLTTGDVHFSRNYTRRIQQVTAEQVHAMARKYFTFDKMAITRMVPAEEFDVAEKTARDADTRKATTFTLPNGLRVVLQPSGAVGLASMTFASVGGVLVEDEKTNGLGTLMAMLSTRGAGERSAEDIAEFFDQAGGSIAGACGNNTFYWRSQVLSENFPEALAIFADVIVRPTFPADELKIVRPVVLRRIRARQEDPSSQLNELFRRRFFAGSPMSNDPTGQVDAVTDATVEDLAKWHSRHILGGSSVLAIYGNFDVAAAEAAIRKQFAGLPKGKGKVPQVDRRKVDSDGEVYVKATAEEVKQAGVMLAVPGMEVTNDDRFAITVLDTIMSGYRLPSGWLHSELRGKGLVYSVHAYNWAALVDGAFIARAGCQPSKVPEVLDILEKNFDRALSYTPTETEIKRAVNVILTAEVLGNQSMAALSMQAALDELYGFGYDFQSKLAERYRQVTPADVRRVAKKYLAPPRVKVVVTPTPENVKDAR
ncbi:MAG: M16 family metallopeptidase [Phycisphaerae bacterium]